MFTDKEHRGPFEFSDELGNLSIGGEVADNVVSAQRVEANDKDLLLTTSDKEETRVLSNNGSAYAAPYDSSSTSVFASQTQIDLAISNPTTAGHAPQASLAIDDLLGLGLSAAPAPPSPQLKLNTKAVLDPSTFQQKWRQLPVALSQVCLSNITIYNLITFSCEYFLFVMPISYLLYLNTKTFSLLNFM